MSAPHGSDGQRQVSSPWIWAAWLLVLLVVLLRVRLLQAFGFRYTDEDQAILWYAARDFAAGHVREPCFFGQPYGTAVEGLLAAPLVWLRVPLWIALPSVATALSVAPFLLLARWAWRSGASIAALVTLAVPLVLPPEYSAMSGMPRGFAPAPFAAACGLLMLVSRRPWVVACGALLEVLGFSFNESAGLLVLPVFVYAGLSRYRERPFVVAAGLGASVGALLHVWSRAFYKTHPAYSLHPAWPIKFEWPLMLDGWHNLDRYFSPYTPRGGPVWLVPAGVALLLVLVAATRYLPAVIAAVSWGSALALALGVPKVHDGSTSVFFSVARSFLSLPVGFVFLVVLAGLHSRVKLSSLALIVGRGLVVVVAVGAFAYQVSRVGADVAGILQVKDGNVPAYEVTDVVRKCDALNAVALTTATPLVGFRSERLYAYACGALDYGQMETLFPSYERRTWLLQDAEKHRLDRMLIYPATLQFCQSLPRTMGHCEMPDPAVDVVLFQFERQSALRFWRHMGLQVRRL